MLLSFSMTEIENKIFLNSGKYRITIPKLLMVGMNWKEGYTVTLTPDPEKNEIVLTHSKHKPAGWLSFNLHIRQAKWLRNSKKYRKEINANLSPEGRAALHNTNWSKVEDGGYRPVEFSREYARDIKSKITYENNQKIKEAMQKLVDAHNNFANVFEADLKKRGCLKPVDLIRTSIKKKSYSLAMVGKFP